ncbi:MAG: hypothetical protein J0H68_06295 [Sphingobacteriia bacterium]|nr:hypothetical protein [Sphingobacteriia bacterium]
MKKYLCVLLLLLIAGCATVLSGLTQTIHIKVVDNKTHTEIHKIHCTVIDGKGNHYEITTNPASLNVNLGHGTLRIECVRNGYRQVGTVAGENFNVLTIGNVLFWPGFVIDAASGAYKKYPTHYIVKMAKE